MKNRIEINPAVLGGKPVIKGTRIPVYLILDLIAAGKTINDILKEYSALTEKDVVAAIEYASSLLKREEIVETEV